MPVRFRFDEDRAVAAVLYLLSSRIPDLDKGKIAKLLFLAEKYHLVRYGRPITGDEYFALPHGPVPSDILNLLNREERQIPTPLTWQIELDRSFGNPHYSIKRGVSPNFDALSKSDQKALDFVAQKHGNKTFSELRAMTHEMPAWLKAWNRKGSDLRSRMDFEDFFEEESDAIEGMLALMIEDANFF